ncbi:hypothetical protein N0V83_000367 [Neocucurbitaria cava]|uniref:Gfd2/YDR514C-like C-terminal domain-containing protein n=1 Tax=Neocucurbitaria cava TaxID=798079 RepID=A0A9W9CRY1_9PLEO|nr:hypothetical protein N0V83_000367 [Neocucurbitaria cava]
MDSNYNMSFNTGFNPNAPPFSSRMTPPMLALRDAFANVDDVTAWNHCLGLRRLNNIPPMANDLADHIIVVCLDCEHWSENTDETTEIGFGTFKTQDLRPFVQSGNFGDHAENLMKQIRFYLLRTIPHSHLPKTNPNSRGVEGNRFGQARFATFTEARSILGNVFIQPIKNVASLRSQNHPIVVLGQDITHDRDNLKDKDVAFDVNGMGTVIRYIDTQVLAGEAGFWNHRNEKVGLRSLVQRLWFQHSDPHTAANDVGRTLISAFQLALINHPCKKLENVTKSMLQVADGIEAHSRATFQSLGGSAQYCWKCGSREHMIANCRATGLRCEECWSKGRFQEAGTHITLHCMWRAQEKAQARRAHHEEQRRRAGAQPRRSYRGRGQNYQGYSIIRNLPPGDFTTWYLTHANLPPSHRPPSGGRGGDGWASTGRGSWTGYGRGRGDGGGRGDGRGRGGHGRGGSSSGW